MITYSKEKINNFKFGQIDNFNFCIVAKSRNESTPNQPGCLASDHANSTANATFAKYRFSKRFIRVILLFKFIP